MQQLSVAQAHALYQQAYEAGYEDIRAAVENGRADRNDEAPFEQCPYDETRSARRRAAWQLAWIETDACIRLRELMAAKR